MSAPTETEAANVPSRREQLATLVFIVALVTSPGWLVAVVQAMEVTR